MPSNRRLLLPAGRAGLTLGSPPSELGESSTAFLRGPGRPPFGDASSPVVGGSAAAETRSVRLQRGSESTGILGLSGAVNIHRKFFDIWLFSESGDAIAATLARVCGTWSEPGAQWLLPSADKPLVRTTAHCGHSQPRGQRGFGMSIAAFDFDVDFSTIEYQAVQLSRCCGISLSEAYRLRERATAWICAETRDRAAATSTLPYVVQAILTAHDGVAWDESHCWKSDEVRAGQTDGMDCWPFPSVEEEFHRSDAVFVGRPTIVPWDSAGGTDHQSLHVLEVLRGDLPRTVAVANVGGGQMAAGKAYLLFVSQGSAGLSVDWRGNSGGLPDAAATLAEVRGLAAPNRQASR